LARPGIRIARSPYDEHQVTACPQSGRYTTSNWSGYFEREGFRYDRQEGDHLIYVKDGLKRPLVIPIYRAVPVFIIKNLLRTSGVSRERYSDLLGKS